MARAVTVDWLAEATAERSRPILLYEGMFGNGVVLRLWNGIGDLSWDSKTWLGNGWFHGVTPAVEDEEINASNMEVLLAGVPSSTISAILGSFRQGASGKLWIGFIDSAGLVVDPYLQFVGKLDTAEVRETVEQPMLTVTYESELVEMERPKEFRFNHETQRYFYPEDRGFEYVQRLQETPIFWGRTREQVLEKKEKEKKKEKRGSKKRSRR